MPSGAAAEEEDFFNRAESHKGQGAEFESFDDLDEGYEPRRVLGSRVRQDEAATDVAPLPVRDKPTQQKRSARSRPARSRRASRSSALHAGTEHRRAARNWRACTAREVTEPGILRAHDERRALVLHDLERLDLVARSSTSTTRHTLFLPRSRSFSRRSHVVTISSNSYGPAASAWACAIRCVARRAVEAAVVGVARRVRGAPLGRLERRGELEDFLVRAAQRRLARPRLGDVVVVVGVCRPVLGEPNARRARTRRPRARRARTSTRSGRCAYHLSGRKSRRVNSVVSGASASTASRPPSRRSTSPSAWSTSRPAAARARSRLSVDAPVVTTSSRMTTGAPGGELACSRSTGRAVALGLLAHDERGARPAALEADRIEVAVASGSAPSVSPPTATALGRDLVDHRVEQLADQAARPRRRG